MSDRREQLIRIIIGEGMMRRDVATDVADAIIAAGWACPPPCIHPITKPVLTEVGLANQCVACGHQDFR